MFDIFPTVADEIIIGSPFTQYRSLVTAGYFPISGLAITRNSASKITVALGVYAKAGMIAPAFSGDNISGISAAAAGKHRYDTVVIDGADDTLKLIAGTEDTPSVVDDFLENVLPRPPSVTAGAQWVVLGIIRIDETGITNTSHGSFAANGIAHIRLSNVMAADNSTLLTSGNIISIKGAGITSSLIASGQIGGPQLASGAVTSSQLGAGVVLSANIASGQVGGPQLASGAVTSSQLGAGVVLSANIASGQIGPPHMAIGTLVNRNLIMADDNATSGFRLASCRDWINYIINNAADVDITDWATYADAAATSPVDGTGGSPNSTWTRNTSSPLRGAADFKLAKDAANRQGEGVSYNFTIDSVDQTKVLKIEFDWMSDVTLTTGDLVVYIYDVTNAILIQPAPYQLPGTVASAKNSWQGEFQTAYNSTSYRLIIHIASTSVTAWNIQFDNISVCPQALKQGVIVTDWVSWTPTGSWIANTTYVGKWKRVGDYLYYAVEVQLADAPTSATLTINLPSGMTIDTTKLNSAVASNSLLPGTGSILDSGTKLFTISNIVYSSTTAIQPMYDDGGGSALAITQAAPITFANNDRVYIVGRVPILGWSSNCQVSSDAETRVTACKAVLSTEQTGVNPNNSWAQVKFNQINSPGFDTHGVYNISNWTYYVPLPGKYLVSASTAIIPTNVLNNRYVLSVFVNGVENVRLKELTPAANTRFNLVGSATVNLNANDQITLHIWGAGNNSVNTLTIATDVQTASHFNIARISGPSQIAASELVYAIYKTATAQSLTGGIANIIDYNIKESDSHGTVTTGATWKFVAPMSGLYHVTAMILANSTGVLATHNWDLTIYKNGAIARFLSRYLCCADGIMPNPLGSTPIYLLAGDYIDIRIQPIITNTLYTNDILNYVTIERVS